MAHRRSFWRIHEHVAGLDIGQDYVAAAHVAPARGGTFTLRHAACVRDGAPASDRELSRRIRQLWKASKISTSTVRVCLRSPSLVVKFLRLDHVTEEESHSAMRLEAETALQLEPSQLAVDACIHRSTDSASAGGVEGILVAAPRDEVDQLLRVVREAGLYPVAIDTACMAMAELAAAWRAHMHRQTPVCACYVTAHAVDLAVVGLGPSVYARSILSRTDDEAQSDAYLATAICDNLKFIRFKLHKTETGSVLLTGDGAVRPAFANAIRATCTEAEVRVWNPLADLVTVRGRAARDVGGDETKACRIATAIGLSARGG